MFRGSIQCCRFARGLGGPAISYAVGQGATMITAVWGVFVWKEFKGSTRAVNALLTLMFLTFLIGLTLTALAPTVH